jgi:hypothetical protein
MRMLSLVCLIWVGLTQSLPAQISRDAAIKSLKFREIGPAVMGGRVDTLAVVESDPRVAYV